MLMRGRDRAYGCCELDDWRGVLGVGQSDKKLESKFWCSYFLGGGYWNKWGLFEI